MRHKYSYSQPINFNYFMHSESFNRIQLMEYIQSCQNYFILAFTYKAIKSILSVGGIETDSICMTYNHEKP